MKQQELEQKFTATLTHKITTLSRIKEIIILYLVFLYNIYITLNTKDITRSEHSDPKQYHTFVVNEIIVYARRRCISKLNKRYIFGLQLTHMTQHYFISNQH